MTISIVNLTLLNVNAELENLLVFYPAQIQRNIFANPDLRQKLLTYVLKRINNHYVAFCQENISVIPPHTLYCSTFEQLEIEELIQQGIYCLLKQPSISNSLKRCRKVNST
ncbi:MAG: hypothetical protein U7123_23400 [Potamolinea sp.]